MGLLLLRCFFIFAAAGVGVTLMRSGVVAEGAEQVANVTLHMASFFGVLGIAIVLVIGDMLLPRKRVEWISSIYVGLFVGLVMTYTLGIAILPLFPLESEKAHGEIMLVIGICLCYLCTSFLIQTRDDFRFIIPYVEFQKNLKGVRPLILDTSVVIDGRIADIADTKIFDAPLIIPKFAIDELQNIADSTDRNRRMRGRRGLDILSRLQKMKTPDLQIDDRELPIFQGQPVDLKLVALTKHLEGKLVTNDYNLNKVARLHGVDVINLNDLANAMRPVFLPGEIVEVDVVKSGEEATQGIGYLEDGTMIVIDGARSHIGERVKVVVTSVLQTSAGKMIFARFESTVKRLTGTTLVIDSPSPIPNSGSNRYGKTGSSGSARKNT